MYKSMQLHIIYICVFLFFLHQWDIGDKFYMITKGEAEVTDKILTVRDTDGVVTLQDRFLTRYVCVYDDILF
jgi:hypothetical protein